jgi:hypothetical protein
MLPRVAPVGWDDPIRYMDKNGRSHFEIDMGISRAERPPSPEALRSAGDEEQEEAACGMTRGAFAAGQTSVPVPPQRPAR